MTGRHSAGGTPPDDAARDAALDARLRDYGDRWRTATSVLDEPVDVAELLAERAGAGRRRRLGDGALVLGAVAASVAVVLGIAFGLSSLTGGSPDVASPAGTGPSPATVPVTPTSDVTSGQSGRLTLSFTPSSTVTAPTSVTVTVTGFSPSAPVAVGVCPANRTIVGPGDCGRSKNLASRLVTAGADGSATATILIPVGPLENQTPPSASCGPADPCVLSAVDISKAADIVAVPIDFGR